MEGFVNEKIYDADTKDKLIDIIQSKEARENFLDFIYDHHAEFEKWQAFYQERSRIRIIEWLRANHFHFVFEEDLEFPNQTIEKLKKSIFLAKVGKDVESARKILTAKAKTYYSSDALNPRPKRGRPPKLAQKIEFEPQITTDVYVNVPNGLRPFIFSPELTGASSSTFSSKFGYEEDLFASRRTITGDNDLSMEGLESKLAVLRKLSSKWQDTEKVKPVVAEEFEEEIDFNDDDDDDWSEDDDDDGDDEKFSKPKKAVKKTSKETEKPKKAASSKAEKPASKPAKAPKKVAKPAKTKPLRKLAPVKPAKKSPTKQTAKAPPPKKAKALRPMMALKKRKTP